MSENINYRKKVNQQLAGAAFQLTLLQEQSLTPSPLQQASCRQAALYHLYLSVIFYINEVLDIYKREPIDFSSQSLDILFADNLLKNYSMIEFNELQRWYEKDNSPLNYLMTLHQKLQDADEPQPTERAEQKNLIAAVGLDETLNLLTGTQKVVAFKNELSSLIDRQRESLLEH